LFPASGLGRQFLFFFLVPVRPGPTLYVLANLFSVPTFEDFLAPRGPSLLARPWLSPCFYLLITPSGFLRKPFQPPFFGSPLSFWFLLEILFLQCLYKLLTGFSQFFSPCRGLLDLPSSYRPLSFLLSTGLQGFLPPFSLNNTP